MDRATIRPLILLAAFATLVLLTEVSIRFSPPTVSGFFLGEQSCNLWLADELNQGKVLYRDVFSNYGALPAYLYAWLAGAFGNSPQTFLRMQQVEIWIVLFLAWLLLRRGLKPESAALFLLVFAGPLLLFTGDRTSHIQPERILILAVALAWRPVEKSTMWGVFAAGALMGAMQINKFGGGFVAIGAWVMTEAYLQKFAWRAQFGRWIVLAAGYVAATLLWGVFLLFWLPRALALDVLWPAYMRVNYQIYPAIGVRWPRWINLHDFFAIQLEPLVALGLVATLIVMLFPYGNAAKREGLPGAGSFLFLAFFFLLGTFIYFGHVWLIYENCWILILASAFSWNRLPAFPRVAVALIFFLIALVNIHRVIKPKLELTQLMVMPTGDKLWATDPEAETIVKTSRAVASLTLGRTEKAVFVVGMGSGWHHFLKWPAANRISVWLMAGFVRPQDNGSIIASLNSTDAVLVAEKVPGPDPHSWTRVEDGRGDSYPSGLSPAICEVLARRLAPPVAVNGDFSVFPVQPSKGQ